MARKKVPAARLNELLREYASRTAECESCTVGPVVAIHPDASGCNWGVSVIHGAHSGRCLVALSESICRLRAEYLLEQDAEMDPTLLTTWAMQ